MGHHGTLYVSAPIRRRRDGRFTVKLDPSVRAVLVTMAEQLTRSSAPTSR